MINAQTASHLVDAAVEALENGAYRFRELLDGIPAAIYVTDRNGAITYFNQACVELAGRTPAIGIDKWCVTWKLRTPDGRHLPHDQCPMAVALRDEVAVRDVEAIAERPDGDLVHFIPFPTPLFDAAGNMTGAVNLLMDITEQRKPDYLRAQANACRRLAADTTDENVAETLQLMAAKYDQHSLRYPRRRAHR